MAAVCVYDEPLFPGYSLLLPFRVREKKALNLVCLVAAEVILCASTVTFLRLGKVKLLRCENLGEIYYFVLRRG